MKTIKAICQAIARLVKQVCLFSRTIAQAGRQRQRQAALDKLEAERLDRICRPEKYRGK